MSVTPSNRIFRAEHKSYDGELWRVDIHDSLAASENTRETVLDASGINIKMEGRTELYDFIHPTTAEFTLMIQNSDHETAVNAIALSGEQRYFAFIYKNNVRVFVGAIMNDTVTEEDISYPYGYTINAIDGLAALRDKEYSNNGVPFTGRETVAKILLRALNRMPTAGFYDDGSGGGPPLSEYILHTSVNWYESQMPDTTKDPLEWTQLDHRIFDKRELSADEPEFYSCWEVIEMLCLRFGARLMYTDGSYYFIQPHLYASDSTFWAFKYLRNAGTSSTSGLEGNEILVRDATNTTANVFPAAGGTFSYYRPVKRVKLKFYHSTYNYLRDYTWDDSNNNSVTVDEIDTTSGNVRMILKGRFWAKVSDSGMSDGDPFDGIGLNPGPVRVILRFRISVGTYHLKRLSDRVFASPSYQPDKNGEWLDSTEFFEVHSDPFTFSGEFRSIYFEVDTDALPNIGAQTWTIDQVTYTWINDGNIVVSPDTFNWKLNDPVGYLYDDENPFKTKFFTWHIATNSNNNQRDVEYEIPFADEPNGWSVDRMTVWDGSDWVDSENWQVDKTGTQYSINDLLVRTMASLQKLPIKTREGTIIKGDIYPYSRINYQGTNFIPAQLTNNTNRDQYSGEIIAIAEDDSGITVTNEITEIVRPLYEFSDERAVVGASDYSFYNGVSEGMINALVSSGAVTSLTIVPANYSFLKNGDQILLLNPYNSVRESLTVTADVNAADTTISVSGTLTNSFPVGTRIFIDPEWLVTKSVRESNIESANWDGVTAAFIDLTTPTNGDAITTPDSDTLTDAEINKRLKVWRNGVKQRYRGDYSGAFTDYGYKIDDDNDLIYFFPALEAEDIEIENLVI